MQKISIGFSPCPNDCFIFDALIHKRIDTENLDFEVYMEDVEALNQRAFRGELDVTKLSYHSYAYLTRQYILLNAGSALGNNCGPLLISKKPLQIQDINAECKIAIPGKYTTANFLFSIAFPQVQQKQEIIFSGIEEAVLNGVVDAGVIIHENRFTYEQRGLHKVMDLGEYWETKTKAPIPLGGIVAKRSLPKSLIEKIDRLIRRSVEYAFLKPSASMPYVKEHAQEMEEVVMKKHIDLYVNQYSIDLGEKGRGAVQVLFTEAIRLGVIKEVQETLFA